MRRKAECMMKIRTELNLLRLWLLKKRAPAWLLNRISMMYVRMKEV